MKFELFDSENMTLKLNLYIFLKPEVYKTYK